MTYSIDLFDNSVVENNKKHQSLSDQYIIPPMSIFDARQGYWRVRKNKWLSLGIKSGCGRKEDLLNKPRDGWGGDYDTEKGETLWGGAGSSIFDPVLCEIAYAWFCPRGGEILDPFAGGSVRGIVASYMGYNYTGIELRKEQVEENKRQANGTLEKGNSYPNWIVGDSNIVLDSLVGKYDFVFTCPPYYNLEIYSDQKGELSNYSTYEEFLEHYKSILVKSLGLLKDNRFIFIVVSNLRDSRGFYYNFVGDTIEILSGDDVYFYNDIVFITPYGTLPMRSGRYIESSRKVGKAHQNILVFCKGDPKKATEDCSDIEIIQL